MPAPANADEFIDLVRKSGVVEEARLNTYIKQLNSSSGIPSDISKFAGKFVRDGLLTFFQAEQFLLGKWKRFTIGKYKVLERLGSGGMGQVFLCEHKLMRRKVAVKVLPTAKAEDSSSLERFYREARAVAALDHPNIVRAYDIDQDENLHFLVMEYVDGASLQELIKKFGPMDPIRACHYIYWSAIGLTHAHEAGLIHRDIKPGNILIDRQGIVKILDMGLARFFNDDEDMLTKKYDENVLGTADYLAPEQAIDSHTVDGRADIYSLGATFYFMLTGHQPFTDGTVAQKLIWHQTRNPKSIRDIRPEVPEDVVEIVEKMMAKDPANRYQTPGELAEALSPFVQTPIDPPPEREMPTLSAAAQAVGGGPVSITTVTRQVPQFQKPAIPSSKPASGSGAKKKDISDNGSGRSSEPVPVLSGSGASVSDSEQTKRRSGASPAVQKTKTSTGEPALWDSLSTDTNNASRDKTDRQSSSTPQPRKPVREPEPLPVESRRDLHQHAKPRSTPMLPLIIGGVALLIFGVGFLIYWLTRGDTKPTDTAPVDVVRLTVSRSGGAGQYNTVKEAVQKAKEGDRIVILDSPWEEELTIGRTDTTKGVTIEGTDTKEITWRIKTGRDAEKIISLQKSEGLTIRNLVFEGNSQTKTGILIADKASGLLIENVTIRDMKEAGIRFYDCSGSEGKPAVVERCRITGNSKVESKSGILFTATSEATGINQPAIHHRNEWITVRDCRLEGPFSQGAFTVDGNTEKVELRQNRIYRATDGVHFMESKSGQAFRIAISNNTFHTISGAGIRFKKAAILMQKQNADRQSIEIERNYFYRTTLIVKSDDNQSGLQFRPAPLDNVRHDNSREGTPSLGCAVFNFEFPTNLDDNKTFLHYPSNSQLNAFGPSRKPVGVPPGD